jgi:hypothetical protein
VHEAQLVIDVDANNNQVVVPVIMVCASHITSYSTYLIMSYQEAVHEAQPTIDVDAYDEQAAILVSYVRFSLGCCC